MTETYNNNKNSPIKILNNVIQKLKCLPTYRGRILYFLTI